MDEQFEDDFMSQFLDNIFNSNCNNCKYRADCTFEDKSKCCEQRFNTSIQVERIA